MMSTPKQNQPLTQKTMAEQHGETLNKQQKHITEPKISSSIEPIIKALEVKVESQFLSLHNNYLLQSFKRKASCYTKFIEPPLVEPNSQQKKNVKKSPQSKQKSSNSLPSQTLIKASPEQVLEYYACFDSEISLSNQRYLKLHKKTEENRFRLTNCIEDCSGKSKGIKEKYQKCQENCRVSYVSVMTKLYSNFYSKFLDPK